MSVPRPLAALILLVTVGAAVWLAREDTVTRHYMPGPLGEQRVAKPQLRTAVDRGRMAGGGGQTIGDKAQGTVDKGPQTGGSANIPAQPLPAYLTRNIVLRDGPEQQWGTLNGLTAGIPFSHNLNHVFPRELFDAHPEFFPLVDGKRLQPAKGSYSWNPDLGRVDVAAYAAGIARKYFEQHGSAVSFSLGTNDGLIFGESPETLEHVFPPRWFRGRPDYTNLVFTFMNRAAEDLSHTHPDKYLGALAYYWAENAPTFRVHPQVIPFLTADRAQSYDPAFKAEEFQLQRKWAEAVGLGADGGGRTTEDGGRKANIEHRTSNIEHRTIGTPEIRRAEDGSALDSGLSAIGSSIRPSQISDLKSQIATRSRVGLYDYLDGYGFLIPRVPVRAFAEHVRHARLVGFTDYYGEAKLNWGVTGPLHWVLAQLLSQPDADVEVLLDEYYREYFREAAAPMRQFFERCEAIWMRQPGPSYWLKYYRSEAQSDLFPSAVCGELRQVLEQAARLAKARIVRDRVEFVSDSFGLTERFVGFEEAREALANAVLRTESGGGQSLMALLGDYLSRRAEFIRYSLALRRGQPLAFYPINHDDWLRNDPTFAAARRLVREYKDQASEVLQPLAHHPAVAAALNIGPKAGGTERLKAGHLGGPVRAGQQIAGLRFGVDLPAPWQSRVEPMEHGVHVLVAEDGGSRTEGEHRTSNVEHRSSNNEQRAPGNGQRATNSEQQTPGNERRILRISGAENTTIFQWLPVKAGMLYASSMQARGRVSSSHAAMLTLGWLDAKQRPIGKPIVMRLPDGTWDDWVTLEQGQRAPKNAAWAGVGLRIQHQLPGDWAEFRRFSLREFVAP